jgi:Beta-propeller repeat
MVNRSGVGPAFARVRGLVLLVLLVLGAAWLLRRDIATPHSPNLPASTNQTQASLARLPISFEPNQGQTDATAKFAAHGRGYGLYLTPSEAVLTLPDRSQKHLRQAAVEMQLAGANQRPEVVGAEKLPGHSNYFIGNDPSRWLRNIPQYGRVQYRQVYPGIDLAFYGNQNQLEYDFEVSPGSDAHQIELNFKGATNVSVAKNGDLVLGLDGRELRFEAPHVYQKFAAGTQTIAGSFVMRGKNSAGFELGPYDHNRELVIDPVLAFSSYLGGAGEESCTAITGASAGFVPHCPAIAVDSGGRIYVAGSTTSTGAFNTVTPTVIGSMGTSDVFISRISLGSTGGATTSTLDYVTYIGGTGTQYPTGVGVDSGFNVYVAGTTNATNYPTTPSAFQTAPSPTATGNHVFISKLDSTGSVNLYSTYLSGTGVDTASNMAVDNLGRVYVIGTTTSSDFPTTIGALQAHPAATNQFFFAKVNPALNTANSLQYSTYIGGSTPANGVVVGGAVAVDASFNVYLAGGTDFTDIGTTPQPWIANAYKSGAQGGVDVWAAKLNAPPANTQQYALNYGTYFGGSGDDVAYGVATDATNTYITGSTTSTDITVPNTTLAFQTTNGGGGDAFVAKFGVPAISGTSQGTVPLDYFSYLGGSAQDDGLSIAADTLGNAYVTGLTAGSFHLANAFQGTFGGGAFDAFVARLNSTGTSTTTSTSTSSYLGGSGKDIGTGIALDSSLNTYVTGETAGTFPIISPLTGGGSISGTSDAFVAQLGPNTSVLTMPDPTPTGALPACGTKNPTVSPSPVGVGSPATFTYYIYNQGDPVSGVVFTDKLGVNSGSTSATTSQGTCGPAVTSGTLICTLGTVNSSTLTKLSTANSCGATQSVNFAAKVTVTVNAPTTVLQGSNSVGNSATLSFPGGATASIGNSATVNDFSVSATLTSPSTGSSIPSGGQVNYSVMVTPTGSGFPESVAISCGAGLPAGSACSFPSPTGATISSMSSGPQSRTLAISTTARVTTTGSLLKHGITYALWLPILGIGLIGAGVSRKRRVLMGVFFSALVAMALLQAGCSSSSTTRTTNGTPAGTYTVTVNATSGAATRTTTVQFTVQ